MTRRSSPWTILLLTLVLCLLGIAVMEYMRYAQNTVNADLEQQVKDANAKAAILRNREEKLKQNEAFRNEVEPRLLRAADGQVHAQILMAVVRAARESGVTASPIAFGSDSGKSGAKAKTPGLGMGISFQIDGSEAQVLRFIALLEEGKPLSQIGTIQWNIPIQKGQDPASHRGAISLKITVHADPAKPPATNKP